MARGVKRAGEGVDMRHVAVVAAGGSDKGLMGRIDIDKHGGTGQSQSDLGHFVGASTPVRSPCQWEAVIGRFVRRIEIFKPLIHTYTSETESCLKFQL